MTAQDEPRSLYERLERLQRLLDEKDEIAESIKELKLEIRARGFSVRTIERLVKIKRTDSAKTVAEERSIEAVYAPALGIEELASGPIVDGAADDGDDGEELRVARSKRRLRAES